MTVSAPAPRPDDPLLAEYLARRANLVRFLAARARSLATAEDLAQDLYLKIAARDRTDPVENPQALLFRMAVNLMLDQVRGETRAAARDQAWRLVAHTEMAGVDIANEPPADEAAVSAERLRRTHRRGRRPAAADGPRLPAAQARRAEPRPDRSGHGSFRQGRRKTCQRRAQGAHHKARVMSENKTYGCRQGGWLLRRRLYQRQAPAGGRSDGSMNARAPKPVNDDREELRRAQAADWVVRLQAGDLTDADVSAFDAWLSASEANGPAYDAALAVMQEVEARALAIRPGPAPLARQRP